MPLVNRKTLGLDYSISERSGIRVLISRIATRAITLRDCAIERRHPLASLRIIVLTDAVPDDHNAATISSIAALVGRMVSIFRPGTDM
jgi:hypothetical protein